MKKVQHFVFLLVFLFCGYSYSQTQDWFLGTGKNTDVQGSSCASCHTTGNIGQPIYDKWKNTLHAEAFDSLNGTPGFSYNCLSCHTTGWDPSLVNGGADEYVKLDTSKKPNYTITNPSRFTQVKNVGCESCHSPLGIKNGDTITLGSRHWQFGTGNKLDYSAENCGKCHEGAHNPYYDEWKTSLHSQSLIPFVVSNKSCVRCHVAQNFIAWAKDPANYKDTILVTGADMQPITCATCHDPHDRTNVAQLRFPINQQSTICDKCHTAGIDSVNVNTTPHHSTSEALSGINFGFKYPGENYINSGHTFAATLRCVNCHVFPTAFDIQIGSAVTGHTFNPRVQACKSCHPDYYTAVDTSNHEKMFDYRGVQTTTDSLINALAQKIHRASHADSLTEAFKEANYNYNSALAEGSHGIHNTRLTQKLLRDALARYNPTSVENEGGEVPGSYVLSQNYPNPFNPTTTIKFSLPEAANVKIIVYDALGKEVEVLANNYYNTGNYRVEWKASNYASGIYFYRIESKNFNMVKKMVLIK